MTHHHIPEIFFVSICGNIGVGKSLFAERLGRLMGLEVYYEPVMQNPYLEPFYADMQRWAFHLQIYFLAERFKVQKRMNRLGQPFIQDRTIYEDGEVFARVLHERGEMDHRDFDAYIALFREMVDYLAPPGLLIYLKASPETLRRRIATRGRSCEAGIEMAYLEQLESAYRDWVPRMKARCPVVEIDTEDMRYPPGRRVLDGIIRRIYEEAHPRGVELAPTPH
ncbi:MAG: deoxynucleoside kinase [Candidatus Eisenbacteria sp.]|nr:deoxynucleoside kinase [Candidatus Eisenbacteria bacterium]